MKEITDNREDVKVSPRTYARLLKKKEELYEKTGKHFSFSEVIDLFMDSAQVIRG